ncbi:MAG: hypothetical protein AAF846_07180 [Chloroflexota bacterium]
MTIYNPQGTHDKYTEVDRHFDPKSEVYTGADSLITAQRNGWKLVNIAYEERVTMRSGRYATLYYFKLTRSDNKMIMPIIANPFIERMLISRRMLIKSLTERANQEIIGQTIEMAAVRVHEG